MQPESVKKYYRIDRREIAFLRFILEAYDGIATLTTVDSATGVVVLRITRGCESEVQMILNDLGKNIMIEPLKNYNRQEIRKQGDR
jgi:hypothetical protein